MKMQYSIKRIGDGLQEYKLNDYLEEMKESADRSCVLVVDEDGATAAYVSDTGETQYINDKHPSLVQFAQQVSRGHIASSKGYKFVIGYRSSSYAVHDLSGAKSLLARMTPSDQRVKIYHDGIRIASLCSEYDVMEKAHHIDIQRQANNNIFLMATVIELIQRMDFKAYIMLPDGTTWKLNTDAIRQAAKYGEFIVMNGTVKTHLVKSSNGTWTYFLVSGVVYPNVSSDSGTIEDVDGLIDVLIPDSKA